MRSRVSSLERRHGTRDHPANCNPNAITCDARSSIHRPANRPSPARKWMVAYLELVWGVLVARVLIHTKTCTESRQLLHCNDANQAAGFKRTATGVVTTVLQPPRVCFCTRSWRKRANSLLVARRRVPGSTSRSGKGWKIPAWCGCPGARRTHGRRHEGRSVGGTHTLGGTRHVSLHNQTHVVAAVPVAVLQRFR